MVNWYAMTTGTSVRSAFSRLATGACALTLLVGAPAGAQERGDGPTSLIITYQCPTQNRAAFRAHMAGPGIDSFEKWKAEGVFQSHLVAFSSFVNVGDTAPDMIVRLDFAKYADTARWKRIEHSFPAGLNAAALRLCAPVTSYLVDLLFEGQASPQRDLSKAVYLWIPYHLEKGVGKESYKKYFEGYVKPQSDGWLAEGVLTWWGAYFNQHPAGRPWDLVVLYELQRHQRLCAARNGERKSAGATEERPGLEKDQRREAELPCRRPGRHFRPHPARPLTAHVPRPTSHVRAGAGGTTTSGPRGDHTMFERTILSLAACAAMLGVSTPAARAQAQTQPASDATPAKADDANVAQRIVVQGQFFSLGAESAMKLAVPIRDTPLSVTNYSVDFIKAVESAEVVDLYKYMTGVSRGGQSAYDLSLRGFKTTSNDRNAIMTDGLPGQVSRFASPPTIGVDHIEVVKGPASVLYGQAQPGGFVNIVLKKPEEDRQFVLDVRGSAYRGDKLSLGDATGYSIGADLTGAVDGAASVLYRFVAEDSRKDGFRDFTKDRSQYAAPSLTWKLSKATQLTVLTEYRFRRGAQDLYLPAPNRDISLIPARTTRLQEPDDYVQEEGYSATVFLAHEFGGGVNVKFSARSVRNHDYTKWYDTVALLSDLTTLQRRARIGDNHRTSDYMDTTLTLPFGTGPVLHKVLLGLTAGQDQLDANRVQFVNGATTGALAKPGPGSLNIDIYNPVYGLAPTHASLPAGTFQHRITASKPVGAYVTDFLTLSEQWKASIGLRYAKEKQTFEETASSVAILPSRSSEPGNSYSDGWAALPAHPRN